MKKRPILFSTPMVQAILNGCKTETRRLIKPQPNFDKAWQNLGRDEKVPEIDCSSNLLGLRYKAGGVGCCAPNIKVPVHKGDILWVRETFAHTDQLNLHPSHENYGYVYKTDADPWDDYEGWRWKPSIFMPYEACRLFLKVIDVRVERLQDISIEDSKKEGVDLIEANEIWSDAYYDYIKKTYKDDMNAKDSFKTLWMSINGQQSWEDNPYVWVFEFQITNDGTD